MILCNYHTRNIPQPAQNNYLILLYNLLMLNLRFSFDLNFPINIEAK